jgi:long-chain acyl-CoA synthetase
MGAGRHGGAERRRRVQRHLPDRRGIQVQYLCEDSRTSVLFVEDDEQLDKALEVRSQLPGLRKIVVFDMEGLRELNDPDILSLDALREPGSHLESGPSRRLMQRVQQCRARGPRHSGLHLGHHRQTQGRHAQPRRAGVLSARLQHAGTQYETDERMCFLPLCHIAERLGGEYFALYTGSKLNFVENPETVPENVREIAPTVFTAVPRVWEKFYSGVMIALKEASPLQQAAYAWGIGVGTEIADKVLAGQPVDGFLKLKFTVARWIALNNARKLIGIHRARASVHRRGTDFTGAGQVVSGAGCADARGLGHDRDLRRGHRRARQPHQARLDRPGGQFNEVRIDADTGEIRVRGPNVFMGYLNQPEKTAETIDPDGWLHTGDVGTVDADGYFRITDRMKDIIITAGGKNITPSELENELKFSPYITDAVVIGDKQPYLTVIIMIDQENVEKYAQDNDVPFSNYASLTKAAEVQALIQAELDRVNKKFARVEQIKKFFLLETQLSAEDEELTPTMKLKRKLVQTKYAPQIEAMYR